MTSLYHPLVRGDIRLLKILAHDGITISCRLETYPLDQAPEYDIVSYCWGENLTTTDILCNGTQLPIRKNLFEALRHFHEDKPPPQRPHLWIDAICLNQEDDDEKAVQVPLMGDFYRMASRCIIWLGMGNEFSDAAMAFIPWVVMFRDQEGSSRATLETEEHQQGWECVRLLLARPWFYRLWTFQETILPPELTFLCGSKSLEWLELIAFDKITREAGLAQHLMNKDTQIGTFRDVGSAMDIRFIEQLRVPPQQKSTAHYSLGQLLYFIEDRRCKEPVDRVWALLGLLPERFKHEVQSAGIVDYSSVARKNYWTSYLATMKKMALFDPVDFFYTITRAQGFTKHPLLPSWCPDWHASRLYNPLQLWGLTAGFATQLSSLEQVGAIIKNSLTLCAEESALLVTGHDVDIVQKVSVLPPPTTFSLFLSSDITAVQSEYRERLEWMSECFALANEVLHGSPDLLEIVCQTLVAFDGVESRKYPKNWQESYDAIKNRWETWAGEDEWITVAADFDNLLRYASNGRKFFNTEHGRVGIGPPDVQAGDKIGVFVGGGPLFILRAETTETRFLDFEEAREVEEVHDQDEAFRLIGDAYVHGLMKVGQAFKTQGGGREISFKLV